MVFFISGFFLAHGKLHIFFHAMFFTIEIIVVRSITGIRYRIFGIMSVNMIELFHQRDKTFHIRCIGFCINHRYIFITDGSLKIICRKQLVISHIVTL